MVQPQAELWKNPAVLGLMSLKVKKRKRGENEIDLAGNRDVTHQALFSHHPAHTLEHHLLRLK